MEEYRKNTEQYRDVQKKAKHFQTSDAKLFQDVWTMNEGKVHDLAREVEHADRVIHTQQLGLEWTEPPELSSPMEHALAKVKSKLSQATIYASQILSGTRVGGRGHLDGEEGEERGEVGGEKGGNGRVVASRPVTTSVQVYPLTIIKRVLELLCEEAGFLLDDKLTRLVAPLVKEEQMMMKLDSMFKSLGVHTEEDIQHLVGYFVHEEEEKRGGEEEGGGRSEDEGKEDTCAVETGDHNVKVTLIHPNDVALAIHQLIEQRKSANKPPSLSPSELGLSSTAQKELLSGSFWQQMMGILPQSHERVWDALLEGLEQYHCVLVSRSKCREETEALSIQNNELRRLLQQYMHSRINEELEIPPTLMLPV